MRERDVIEFKNTELNISTSSHGKLNFYVGILKTGHLKQSFYRAVEPVGSSRSSLFLPTLHTSDSAQYHKAQLLCTYT